MTTVLLLLLASTITGLAAGLFFRVGSLLLVSPATAILVATVLQTSGFGFWTGIPIVAGCLVAGQVAYLAATLYVHRGELSVQDDVDGDPGQRGHRHVDEENE
ncbi:hypothetical protein GGD66_003192 [Bradyrhizobium sp. CIR48]|uniref:hypothetical protein n=1 Tax=unclassified Bradyrhizobium TaxID=2631580 RepID=UPI0008DEC6CF|nr:MULTISPECIES: hypothetical protein [unclassified Bradyrhizobium]MBB4376996.1 hypothetical protein [Bradyrhizobium sp. SBR1B]MBB4424646.1 hypothetical protein [Bradyrhizobium sp. CIR48]SFM91752.1 hypothetical protein SAMN05216573_105478 [Bradyrhizobium sp. Rc3b]